MDIRLNKKTGFKSKSPIVTVWTDEGEPFYIIKRKGTEILFNLPKGNYIIECDFEILKSPVNYKLPKLPKYERNITFPNFIEIVFCTNPNKCSIDLERGLVMCDFSIKNKTRAEQTFVMFHELGHYYYKTESHCDLFASYHMLKQGFNPSQLYFSVNGCLSDNSIDRKNHVLNFAKKVKK